MSSPWEALHRFLLGNRIADTDNAAVLRAETKGFLTSDNFERLFVKQLKPKDRCNYQLAASGAVKFIDR
jgi:hypothetical protein